MSSKQAASPNGTQLLPSHTRPFVAVLLLIAGGACGQLKGNRYLSYPLDTPMMNLGATLLDKVGVHVDKVGDSTGQLTDL